MGIAGFLTFWKRPLPGHRRWINARIGTVEESIRELTRHVEARSSVATAQAVSAIDLPAIEARIARDVEVRLMALSHSIEHAAMRAIERRSWAAAEEAKAYADHGLGALAQSMGGAHRIVAKSSKRLDDIERKFEEFRESGVEATTQLLRDLDARIAAGEREGEVDVSLRNLEADVQNIRLAYDQQLRSVERTVGETVADYNTQLRNVERTVGEAVVDYNTQLRSVESRVEFIRAETMYEVQAAMIKAGKVAETASPTVTRIINTEKVEAARKSGLRLNIGCGHIQPEGFVNVDTRTLPGIDVIANATDIPFGAGEVAEISSSHLVEHFTSHILERVLLPYWASLLTSGGVLTTVAPDGAAMLGAVNDGQMTFEDFREVLFGGQDYDGDFHYNLITPKTFAEALVRAGFVDITEEYAGKRNGKCFEFKVTARKP